MRKAGKQEKKTFRSGLPDFLIQKSSKPWKTRARFFQGLEIYLRDFLGHVSRHPMSGESAGSGFQCLEFCAEDA